MKRYSYLDHARGVFIAFVCLRHSMQVYGKMWGGRAHFVPSEVMRSDFWDGLTLWTDAFIMQGLFFVAGLFVLPSLRKNGLLTFWKHKTIKIIIPWAFALPVLVPPLRYIKHIDDVDPTMGYWDFLINESFSFDRVSQAGYWFLSYLVLMMAGAVLLYYIFPRVYDWLGKATAWLLEKPLRGFLIAGSLVAAMISTSDILGSSMYWTTFWKIFAARTNLMASYFFFFILGIGVRESGFLDNEDFLKKFAESWKTWLGVTIALSLAYIGYSESYKYKGAFTNEIVYYFYYGGTWDKVWPLVSHYGPAMLPRTILHGFVCTAQIITILCLLLRFTNERPTAFWASLGACSYGIYFFHEHLTTWIQYMMADLYMPSLIKASVTFAFGLAGSWLLTSKVLRRLPVLNRVF